jgi:Mg-chelatase subunit ChlD
MNVSSAFIQFHNEEVPSSMRRCAITLKGNSSTARQPVHIFFVIDTSDSMNDGIFSSSHLSKLEQVKRSIDFLLPLLTSSDYVSLISFGDVATIQCQAIQMNEEGRRRLESICHNLSTDGCTNMSAGLLQIEEVLETTNIPIKQGVLLLTDGHANVGATSVQSLETIVNQLTSRNTSLTVATIGYGHNHNADLLRSMAVAGSGSYNVVYDLEGIATTFGEVLGGLTTVVAQNVSIELPYGSIVHSGYATTSSGSHVGVKVGDIYAENEIIVLCDTTEPRFTVKGVDMSTYERIVCTQTTEEVFEETPQNIQLAYYRYKVSTLLREASQAPPLTDSIKEKAIAMKTELEGLTYASDVLVQMMIDDLEQVIRPVERNAVDMVQHSAYLALGRGLRSHNPAEEDPLEQGRTGSFFQSPPLRPMNQTLDEDDFVGLNEERNTLQTPPRNRMLHSVLSPFSNRVQSLNTQVMRTASVRDQEH